MNLVIDNHGFVEINLWITEIDIGFKFYLNEQNAEQVQVILHLSKC